MVDSAPASEGDRATFRASVFAWLGEHAPAHGWERPTNLADTDEDTRLARARTCQRLLGLPREPDPDRGRPFREAVDGNA